MTQKEKISSLITNPSSFFLGLTLAFSIGDEFVKSIIAPFPFSEEGIGYIRDLHEEYISSRFMCEGSGIYIITGGTIIFWRYISGLQTDSLITGGVINKVKYITRVINNETNNSNNDNIQISNGKDI